MKNGFGTVLTDNATINFSSAFTAEGQVQTFTIQNTGNADLKDIALSVVNAPSSSTSFAVDTTGTATIIQPASEEFPNNFTSFKIKFTGSGEKTAIITITSNDPNRRSITLKLAGKSFSNTLDTDGDGLSDNAEYQLRSLGFDWQVAQPDLVKALKDNANLAGLYDTDSALKLNIPLLVKNPITNNFSLTIGIERSLDLKTFTAFPMSDSQIYINSLGELVFQFQSLRTQGFYRLQAK